MISDRVKALLIAANPSSSGDDFLQQLQEAIAKTEALGEQQHQQAQTSAKRVDRFLAEIIDMTGEFAEMSKQIREQSAEMERLRAEL